jgi:hypothetical protein
MKFRAKTGSYQQIDHMNNPKLSENKDVLNLSGFRFVFLEIINLSFINLRTIESLYDR